MSQQISQLPGCPGRDEWLQLLGDARGTTDALTGRPDLTAHLEGCGACQDTVDDVRRYYGFLQRGRAPGLTQEQRQSLDERVRMLAGQWRAPPRVPARVGWAVSFAAATALVFLFVAPMLRSATDPDKQTFAQAVSAAQKGVQTAEVEGDVQFAGVDGHWRLLRAGDALRTGDKLRSLKLAGAPARVVVPGRFELTLTAGAELELLTVNPSLAFLRVRQGEVECQVDKLRPGQKFSVMFAGFRASVLGTRFTVTNREEAGVAVQVTDGAVRIDAADDPQAPPSETLTTVRAGHLWNFAAGRLSLEPTPVPTVQTEAAPAASSPPPASDAESADRPVKAKRPVQKEFVIEVPPQSMPMDDSAAPLPKAATPAKR